MSDISRPARSFARFIDRLVVGQYEFKITKEKGSEGTVLRVAVTHPGGTQSFHEFSSRLTAV